MARSEQNATRRLSLPDNMAGSRSAQNAILANQQLLDAICSSDARNQLDNLGVVEPSITTDNEECVLSALGDGLEDARDE